MSHTPTDPIDTALLPCPFCGGGAEISADMAKYPQVACDACGACCGQAREPGVLAAIAAWNRRAPDTARQEGIALGLSMAAQKYQAMDVMGDDEYPAWDYFAAAYSAILALTPIPPHVAAARVLLDDLKLARDKADTQAGAEAITRWFAAEDAFDPHQPLFFKGLAAALEQIAGGDNG